MRNARFKGISVGTTASGPEFNQEGKRGRSKTFSRFNMNSCFSFFRPGTELLVFCCVLGKDTLRYFLLLGGVDKQS